MSVIQITKSVSIDSSELQEKFVRSGGPGGQNVNKVSTAVQLRFDVRHSPNLPERIKQKILMSGDSRLTKDGVLVVIADSKRTQEANRRDAMERLEEIIRSASIVPKTRIATKPTKASIKRRLEDKAKKAQVKKGRSGKIDTD